MNQIHKTIKLPMLIILIVLLRLNLFIFIINFILGEFTKQKELEDW